MSNYLSSLKMIYAIFIYLRDPNQVDSVLKMGNLVLKNNTDKLNKDVYLQNLKLQEMIKERYGFVKNSVFKNNIDEFDINGMENSVFEGETLGGKYLDYIKKNKLDPQFYKNQTNVQLLSSKDYIVYRIRQTHDFWHLVTEFDTTQEGEAGLIAFYYAQLKTPLSALIVGLSFIHFLRKRPEDLPLLFAAVTRGWQMGLKALPLISYKWEENLHKKISEVKLELNLN